VVYLHFALKRRAFLEEFHEKQEQVGYIIFMIILSCAVLEYTYSFWLTTKCIGYSTLQIYAI